MSTCLRTMAAMLMQRYTSDIHHRFPLDINRSADRTTIPETSPLV
jgi:hypothetical protein